PTLRNITGEGERASVAIDGKNRANDLVIGPLRVLDLQRKAESGAGQALNLRCVEVAFVEIERRLAIELEHHIALRAGHAASGPEAIQSAGAAVADVDGVAVEADRSDNAASRRAIGADEGLAEVGAVACQSAGQGNVATNRRVDAGDQIAAVHAQPICEHENSRQVVPHQLAPDALATGA